MELIFTLLKQLAATLSPTEFLLVLGVMGGTAFWIAKIVIKLTSKRVGLAGILGHNTDTDANEQLTNIITKKFDDMTLLVQEILRPIPILLSELKVDAKTHDESLKMQVTEILLMKHDLVAFHDRLSRELEDIKHSSKMNDNSAASNVEAMKQILQRGQDLIQRISSQIEKIDEFTRSAVPEFRSYHKELSKEVGDLSRDVALVERSIQAQINTAHAVKLR